jgi:hypothetical protein
MADFPIVNGKAHDFSAIETTLPLAGIVREIQEINYSDTTEAGELRASVPWVLASTRGQYSAEGNIVISKQAHVWLVQKLSELAEPLGQGFVEYEFPLSIVMQTAGMPTIKDSLWDCRLLTNEASNSRSPDPNMVSCSLFVKGIYWNGNKPFLDMPWRA